MKLYKIKMEKIGGERRVVLHLDHQAFILGFSGNKAELEWYKRQLKVALNRLIHKSGGKI